MCDDSTNSHFIFRLFIGTLGLLAVRQAVKFVVAPSFNSTNKLQTTTRKLLHVWQPPFELRRDCRRLVHVWQSPFELRRDCRRLVHAWQPPFELRSDSSSLVDPATKRSKTPVVWKETFGNPRSSSAGTVAARCRCLDIGIIISNVGVRMLGKMLNHPGASLSE